MSSVISRMIWRRSSRVSGVRSSTSCSVTARVTRSFRSPVASRLKSSAPSVAMHAWWMRVFSSAYGSCALESGATSWTAVPPRSASAVAALAPLEVLRRSWRPIALRPREGRDDPTLLARGLFLRCPEHLLRHRLDGARDIGRFLREHNRVAPVDRERDRTIRRHFEAHLHPQRALDLVRLHADLRVRAVEDDADARLRERQKVERLQCEAEVLERRDVERAEEQQLVRPVERRQHRAVEERGCVDDDDVERLPRNLEQATELRFRHELSVFRAKRRRQNRQPACVLRRITRELLRIELARCDDQVVDRLVGLDAEHDRGIAELQVEVEEQRLAALEL